MTALGFAPGGGRFPTETGPSGEGGARPEAGRMGRAGASGGDIEAAKRLVVRPAQPEDAGAMAGILHAWVARTAWMPKRHGLRETEGFCAALVPGALVAERGGVAGFLALEEEEVVALYCRDRGAGVGRALLDAAKAGRGRLSLRTFAANAGARRFYAREGFREVGGTAGANAEGLPDVWLEWRR